MTEPADPHPSGSQIPIVADDKKKPISIALSFLLPFFMLLFGGTALAILTGYLGFSMQATVALIQLCTVILPTLWLFHHYRRDIAAAIAFRMPEPLPLAGLLVFLAGLIVMMDTLMYFMAELAPGSWADIFWEMVEAQGRIMDLQTVGDHVWYILFVVLGAGFFEELLFRGLILTASIGRMRPFSAVLLNGVLFAAIHQNPVAVPYYFLLGAVLAHVALRTKTLIYGIVLHCLLNLSALLFYRIFGALVRLPIPEWASIIGGLSAVLAGLALFSTAERRRRVI